MERILRFLAWIIYPIIITFMLWKQIKPVYRGISLIWTFIQVGIILFFLLPSKDDPKNTAFLDLVNQSAVIILTQAHDINAFIIEHPTDLKKIESYAKDHLSTWDAISQGLSSTIPKDSQLLWTRRTLIYFSGQLKSDVESISSDAHSANTQKLERDYNRFNIDLLRYEQPLYALMPAFQKANIPISWDPIQ